MGRRKATILKKLKKEVLRRDEYRCYICGVQSNEEDTSLGIWPIVHVDHFIPESRGGKSTPDNLRCVCSVCNRRKGADSPDSRFFDLELYRYATEEKKVRFPIPLLERLTALAESEGVSLNTLVCSLAWKGLEAMDQNEPGQKDQP